MDRERGIDRAAQDRRFLGDHFLETLKIGNQRRLVDHVHLANHRRSLRKTARRIGPNDVGVDTHELWKSLGQHAEVAGRDLSAGCVKYDDARAPRDARQGRAERTLESDDRDAVAAPGHEAGIPGRRIGHVCGRLVADDLRHAGARHQ